MSVAAAEEAVDPVFLRSILDGLRAPQKTIASKWLYDEEGSRLFDSITELPEYYPTRTEIGILGSRAADLGPLVPEGAALMELGSGSSEKTRLLLDAVPKFASYVPVEISSDHLELAVARLRTDYPDLEVHPVVADFTQPFVTPAPVGAAPVILFFPGSTIGNFTVAESRVLLTRLAELPNICALVIGVDLKKDPDVLVPAYDDGAGVTAAFNLNLLKRLNRELGASFDLDAFGHEARWNEQHSRIEMHLVSRREQEVVVAGERFPFRTGETIHTENSHKYELSAFAAVAAEAGWETADVWTDTEEHFSIHILRLAGVD